MAATSTDLALVLRAWGGSDFMAHNYGLDARAVADAAAEAASTLVRHCKGGGLDSSGDAPPGYVTGQVAVSAGGGLRVLHRLAGSVLILAITRPDAPAGPPARAAAAAAAVLHAAARSAAVTPARIARRYPEVYLALAGALAGPSCPPHFDGAAALGAACAALRAAGAAPGGAAAADEAAAAAAAAPGAVANAPAEIRAALRGALARARAAATGEAPPPAGPAVPLPVRAGGGGPPPRPGTPPARAGARRTLASTAGGPSVALPAGALEPPAGPPGSARAGGAGAFGRAASTPASADAASPDAALLAALGGGGGGAAAAAPAAPADGAAELIALGAGTPSPSSAAAFDAAAAFPPVSLLEAAAAPPPPPPQPALRPASAEALAAVAAGKTLALIETWRAAHVGARTARAGVLGEVRAVGGDVEWAGTDAAAAFALTPPPAGGAAAAAEAALRCALLDRALARPPAPGRARAGRGPALVANVGAAAAAGAAAPPILRYRAPPCAVRPPALARLSVLPPPGPAGTAGALLVLDWAVDPGLEPGAAPAAGWAEVAVPDGAAGRLVRAHPAGAVYEAGARRVRWRLGADTLAPGATGRVWAAFKPAGGAAAAGPDALALAGVPGGGPAAAARGCASALLRAVRPASLGGASLTGTGLVSGPADGGGLRPGLVGTAWHLACRPDA